MPADVRSSVEKFEQPGGTIGRKKKGEKERRGRAFYRCRQGRSSRPESSGLNSK
jgi:hypothetical protein